MLASNQEALWNKSPHARKSTYPKSVGGGIAGAIFALGTMMIFLLGIPVLRYVFPAAIVLGVAVALILHFARHKKIGAPWISPGTTR